MRVTPLAWVFCLYLSLTDAGISAIITWDGGGADVNWGTDNNWNPNGDPALNSDIFLTGGTKLTNNVTGGPIADYSSITFGPDAAGTFLVGGGPLTNGAGGITVNSTSFAQRMTNTIMVLDAAQTWSAVSNSLFTTFSVSNGAHLLTLSVSGSFTNSVVGPMAGTASVRVNGPGVVIFGGDNSLFSGTITNTEATIESQTAKGLGTGNVAVDGGVMKFTTANQTYNQTFTYLDATTNEVESGRRITLGTGNNDFRGSGHLTKLGAGTLIMSNDTDNTGGVTIKAGRVEIFQGSALGTGRVTLDGGELFHSQNTITFSNAFTITSAGGTLSGNSGSDIVFLSSSIVGEAGGTLTLEDENPGANQRSVAFAGGGWTMSNNIHLGDTATRIRMQHASGTNIFAGIISGQGRTAANDGGLSITNVDGHGAVTILRGMNTFTGSVSIVAGTLIMESDQALGATTHGTFVSNGVLAIRGGVNYAAVEGIDLRQGVSNTAGAFVSMSGNNSFAGAITANTHVAVAVWRDKLTLGGILTNSGFNVTFTNAAGSFLTNSGVISGSGSITKRGDGTWVANAANTFSGGISNLGGTIESRVQGGLGSGAVVINGGVMSWDGTLQTNAQNFELLSRPTFSVAANITNTISGAVSGSVGIDKTGTGALQFNGNNSFSGAVTNSAGSLILNHANAMGSSSLVAVEGGTLLFNTGFTNTSLGVRLGGGTLEQTDDSISVGTLTLTADSIIDFRNAGSSGLMRFASATNNTGTAVLTIFGWTGSEAGGTGDLIFFTNSTEVSASFLSNVQFFGGTAGAQLLGTGELVPITPEPGTIVGGIFVFGLLLRKCGRKCKFYKNT